MITKESLQEQLAAAERDFEQAKANAIAADAVIRHCRFLISKFDEVDEDRCVCGAKVGETCKPDCSVGPSKEG